MLIMQPEGTQQQRKDRAIGAHPAGLNLLAFLPKVGKVVNDILHRGNRAEGEARHELLLHLRWLGTATSEIEGVPSYFAAGMAQDALKQQQQRRAKHAVEVCLIVILDNGQQGVAFEELIELVGLQAARRTVVAVVHNGRRGNDHPVAQHPQPPAKIHIFVVSEIILIKAPDRQEDRSVNQQCAATGEERLVVA